MTNFAAIGFLGFLFLLAVAVVAQVLIGTGTILPSFNERATLHVVFGLGSLLLLGVYWKVVVAK